jgi:hypothetical protein
MTTDRIKFIILFFILSFGLFSQDKKSDLDSLLKWKEAYKKKYSEDYKLIITDSIEFTGKLLDMNFGGTCGSFQSSGVFVFKVSECVKNNCPDTLIVIIQCAERDLYRKLLIKGHNYKIRASSNKMKNWVDSVWQPYEKIKRYFLLPDNLTKAE